MFEVNTKFKMGMAFLPYRTSKPTMAKCSNLFSFDRHQTLHVHGAYYNLSFSFMFYLKRCLKVKSKI